MLRVGWSRGGGALTYRTLVIETYGSLKTKRPLAYKQDEGETEGQILDFSSCSSAISRAVTARSIPPMPHQLFVTGQ